MTFSPFDERCVRFEPRTAPLIIISDLAIENLRNNFISLIFLRYIIFDILTVATGKITVLCHVDIFRRFAGTCCLYYHVLWLDCYVCTYVPNNMYPRWRSWLRHCATSRKVAASIPDGVTGIFHWRNRFGRTVALGSTQPLTEMSTRNLSWAVKAAGA
jgi:hypothetical protein